jgi:hypothetical protein
VIATKLTRLSLSTAAFLIAVSAAHPGWAQGTRPSSPSPPPNAVVVPKAPPPPRAEQRPVPPNYFAVWQPGYWSWNGTTYIWNSGQYAVPPQTHQQWVPGRWDPKPGGYVWVPGRWR